LLSRQFQHSLSAAAAPVVAVVEVLMAAVAVAAAFTVAAVAAAFTVAVAAAFMAVFAVMADITAASGLLVEEVITKAAALVVGQGLVLTVRAVVRTAGLKRAAVLAQAEVVRRMFVRQSTMGSGTRSATLAVPGV
jgi:hypothetical protein